MKPAFLLLLLCIGFLLHAQLPCRVQGEIIDSVSKKPLHLVTVALVESVTGKTQRTFSDSLGRYRFEGVLRGRYRILYSFVGYDSLITGPIDVNDETVYPVVALQGRGTILQSVTVTSARPLLETKADGLVYNVASEAQAAGTSALDLLRKVPLVTVDPNGGIGVAGGSSTRIFIDGKPASLYSDPPGDYLAQLPADRIEKIQVITNPSAQYDAEGAGTVILIFTKKNRLKNLTGTLRTLGSLASYRNSLQNSVSLFYKWKKIALSTSDSYSSSMRIDKLMMDRSNADHSSIIRQEVNDTFRRKNLTFNLNMDIEIDSSSSLNINGVYMRWKSTGSVSQRNDLLNGAAFQSYDRSIDNLIDNSVYTTSLAYNKRFKREGQELSFLGFYNQRDRREAYHLSQQQSGRPDYLEDYNNPSVNKEWTIQLDYTQPVGRKSSKWGTGIKILLRNAASNYHTIPFSQNRSGNFSYDQDVYAAYLNYEATMGKWLFRPGLRYEQTELTAFFNNDRVMIEPYRNFVPNATLSRSFKNGNMLSFSYAQSIARPMLSALNPAVDYSDSLNRSGGNPGLKPAITRRLESAYTLKTPGDGFLRMAFYGTRTTGSLVQVTRLLTKDVAMTSWENSGFDRGIGLTTSWNQPIGRKLRVTLNLNGGWRELKIPASGIGNSGWSVFSSVYFNYAMGKGFTVDGYMMAQSAAVELQGTWSVIFPQYYLIEVGKKLWKDKAGVSFRMDSFFNPRQPFTRRYYDPSFSQTNVDYLCNQLFQLAFRWRFNGQTKETRSRAASKAQEATTD
ncbi:MAG: TonB-dependent receptor [Bacteroidetes bacterium]|nr:TonB-dependent receptor [Bacteroidota bacterium]